jgi:hypothetical protein
MINSIPEISVFTALRTFLLAIVPAGVEVVRAQVNRVASPKGDFISMTPISQARLGWNTVDSTLSTKNVKRPTEYTIQLDFYGTTASDNATITAAMFLDDLCVQSFKTSGFDISPLTVDDVQQMPLTTGEAQYLERWTMKVAIQVNSVVTMPTETANALAVGLVSVEHVYPI